jgi:retron-type reverse transcriptase
VALVGVVGGFGVPLIGTAAATGAALYFVAAIVKHLMAHGVDGESTKECERDLKGNLYKLWNRLSSGTYFPAPVRAVEIPKKHGQGKVRVLGVPTVADRVAQTVARLYLEPKMEPLFHPDSYGYRPGRSALQAVGVVVSDAGE